MNKPEIASIEAFISVITVIIKNSTMQIQTTSTITCPECGHAQQEKMPTDACQFFYECSHCHTLLKPREGDCCVFCSYGSVACPPVQEGESCC